MFKSLLSTHCISQYGEKKPTNYNRNMTENKNVKTKKPLPMLDLVLFRYDYGYLTESWFLLYQARLRVIPASTLCTLS